jgi:hypothetical protein
VVTFEITEVLYAAIQITATMQRTTVPAFIGSVLRETQVSFFAEASESQPDDEEVLDIREAVATLPGKRGDRGSLERAILDRLAAAPDQHGVFDLDQLRREMVGSHHRAAVSRAVHTLIRRGALKPVGPGSRVRYVRRGSAG